MASILPQASNVVVNGGYFVAASYNTSAAFEPPDGIDLLRRRSAVGAIVDSGERFNPPRCAADTRITIISTILDWIASEDENTTLLWIYGPAGAGKTALAQTIAEICQREKFLAGSFFFSRVGPTRGDGRLLVATLAYQLILAIPSTRSYIKSCIEDDPSIFERATSVQIEKLFVEPLNKAASSWSSLLGSFMSATFACFPLPFPQPVLIAIDALDECHDTDIQTELLRVIAEAAPRLKTPTKFLITSRPESHITRFFNHYTFKEAMFSSINLALDNESHNDIRKFLRQGFDLIKRTHPLRDYLPSHWPPLEAIRQIVRKASGQFIYASTIIKYIQSPKHRPEERLKVILGLFPPPMHDAPFAELDALYTYIFSSIRNIQLVLRVVGVLIIPRTKSDGLGALANPTTIERLLCLRAGDVRLLLDDLLSLVSFGERDGSVKILHASLADYLYDATRSERFFVDQEMMHSILAQGYMKCVKELTIAPFNFNPIDFQSYMTSFLAHCERAPLTQELLQDLLFFDLSSALKILITRHKSWLVLNDFYVWLLIGSFFKILSKKEFQRENALRSYRLRQLTNINEFLTKQLSSSQPENYLTNFHQILGKSARFKRCPCTHKDHGTKICHGLQVASSLAVAQNLSLLCQLFYWDWNSAFTTKPRLRYTTAVKQCMKFMISDIPSLNKRLLARQFRSWSQELSLAHDLREAHMACALALLPQAQYTEDLASHLLSPHLVAMLGERSLNHTQALLGATSAYTQQSGNLVDLDET